MATNGTSTVTGINNNQIPYGWTFGAPSGTAINDMIAADTGAVSVFTDTDPEGFPIFGVELVGIHTAGMTLRIGSSTVNSTTARFGPSPLSSWPECALDTAGQRLEATSTATSGAACS